MSLINPILTGWNPDPTIVRVGEDYFIATSSFEYFPGHPIYHSTNLVDWELIGHALNRPSQLSLMGTPADAGKLFLLASTSPYAAEGVWGPGLRYHDGTFYLTSTIRYVYTRNSCLVSFFVGLKCIQRNIDCFLARSMLPQRTFFPTAGMIQFTLTLWGTIQISFGTTMAMFVPSLVHP